MTGPCITCGRQALGHCDICPAWLCSAEDCRREHAAEHGRAFAYADEQAEAEWLENRRLGR